MRTISRAATVALCLVTAGCLPAPSAPQPPRASSGDGLHVLFIGNSLTYVNSLPDMLSVLADSAGGRRIDAKMVAFPDYALEDHWNEGTAIRSIESGGWTHVVMQQGPSASEEGRTLLLNYAPRFAAAIERVNAKPAMYSVWPQSNRPQDYPRAIETYRMAADQIHGVFLPVADAWLAAWKRDANLPLYAPDGLHPSVAGSYLAALVMYAVLLEKSPVGLPRSFKMPGGPVITLPEDMVATLQAAAAEAVAATQASVRP